MNENSWWWISTRILIQYRAHNFGCSCIHGGKASKDFRWIYIGCKISFFVLFCMCDYSVGLSLELLLLLSFQQLQPLSELRSIVVSHIASATTTFSSQYYFPRSETIPIFPSYLPCCTILCLQQMLLWLICSGISWILRKGMQHRLGISLRNHIN